MTSSGYPPRFSLHFTKAVRKGGCMEAKKDVALDIIHAMVNKDSTCVLERVLAAGANPNAVRLEGYRAGTSPLEWCIRMSSTDARFERRVLVLLRYGALLTCDATTINHNATHRIERCHRIKRIASRRDHCRAATCALIHAVRLRSFGGRNVAACVGRALWARRWDEEWE